MSTLFLRAKTKQAKIAKNHIKSERSRYIFKGNIEIGLEVHSDQLVDSDGYGVGLFNDKGEILTPPVLWVDDHQWDDEFSEGLFPVLEIATGKMGYIDERGEWAFPPVDGYCQEFRDGLARINLYPDVIFVNREGNELYRYAQ